MALQEKPELGQEPDDNSALLAELYQDQIRNNDIQTVDTTKNQYTAEKELPGLTIVNEGKSEKKSPTEKDSAPGFHDRSETGKVESGANEILDLLKDGKLSDQDWKKMASLIKEAHEGGFLNQLSSQLNLKLLKSELGVSVNIDSRFAKVQDFGSIMVNIKGLADGEQQRGFSINNSPRVPFETPPLRFKR